MTNTQKINFYTQNGWQGKNYQRGLSLKEIAVNIREHVKNNYSEFKFSVTTSYASMCQELHITLMEGPYKAFKTFGELTEDEKRELIYKWIRPNENLNDTEIETIEINQKRFNYSDELKGIFINTVQVIEMLMNIYKPTTSGVDEQ